MIGVVQFNLVPAFKERTMSMRCSLWIVFVMMTAVAGGCTDLPTAPTATSRPDAFRNRLVYVPLPTQPCDKTDRWSSRWRPARSC
jgi:hypothetical protein